MKPSPPFLSPSSFPGGEDEESVPEPILDHSSSGVGVKSTVSLVNVSLVFVVVAVVVVGMVDVRAALMDDRADVRGYSTSSSSS